MNEFYIKNGDDGDWIRVYKVVSARVNGVVMYEWLTEERFFIAADLQMLSKEEVQVQIALGLLPSRYWSNTTDWYDDAYPISLITKNVWVKK